MFKLTITVLATFVGLSLCRTPFYRREVPGFEKSLIKPSYVSLDNRTNCDGEVVDGRGNTTAEVADLMALMLQEGFDAYIVPSADAHLSEYTADADKRREFISDFTGSAGTAVILGDGQRALWTDGRYFTQADIELDCSWILMEGGQPGVPNIAEWLLQELPAGSVVGADPRLFTSSYWLGLEADLAPDVTLVVEQIDDGMNIVDDVWVTYGRPPYSNSTIYVHDETLYAGQTWQSKVLEMEVEMNARNAQAFVLSMLDEVAWLFNLRAADVPYNPVFRSYCLFDGSRSPPLLNLFIPDINEKVTPEVYAHLGSCEPDEPCVRIIDYDSIGTELQNLVNQPFVQNVMVPNSVSYYIYNLVPQDKRLMLTSPVMLEKEVKNPTEQQSQKNAHMKDATALFQFLYDMEILMANNTLITEISASKILDDYRKAQPLSMGLSFETISAFGSNAAIIHYTPDEASDTVITDQSVYLLDSGGQYLDGTTDVTRTFHFGSPDQTMIEAYTRVLMGQIDFATLIFPPGTTKYVVEILTRRYLYEVGWDFNHGPSHGVGLFLNIHEGGGPEMKEGWNGSDEPGYYEEGYFGIRLESMIAVVEVETKYDFLDVTLGFETLTLFPYEEKLIDTSLLNRYHCDYINNLYLQIQAIMGPHLTNEGLPEIYDFMMNKTQPLAC